MRAGLVATIVCFASTLVYCAEPEEGETPRAEAIKANFDKLVSEDKEVKREALLYFGKVDKTFAAEVPLFTASLKDERNQVRAISAFALGKIGKAAAGSIPEVEKLLTDSSASVQKYAERALERLQPFKLDPKKPAPEGVADAQKPDTPLDSLVAKFVESLKELNNELGGVKHIREFIKAGDRIKKLGLKIDALMKKMDALVDQLTDEERRAFRKRMQGKYNSLPGQILDFGANARRIGKLAAWLDAGAHQEALLALKALPLRIAGLDVDTILLGTESITGDKTEAVEEEEAPTGGSVKNPTADPVPDEHLAQAIAGIKELGGSVIVDKDTVLAVSFSAFRARAKLTDGDLEHLKGLTKLQMLTLNNTKVTDAGLVHLKDLTMLKSLKLRGTKVTDTGLVHLKGMTKLEVLDLGRTEITDAGLVYLKGLTKLEFLNLSLLNITDAGLVHLKGLTKLETLSLSWTKVTDAGLMHLEGLTNLTELAFYNTTVTDAGLVYLKGMAGLKKLDLRGAKVTAVGVKKLQQALANCQVHWRLYSSLEAADKPTSEEVVEAIKELGGKVHVDKNNDVVALGLVGTKVTNAGLEHLNGLAKLQMLTLNNTQVTDAGLVHLKDLPVLNSLDLRRTKVTGTGLVHLKGMTKLEVLYLGRTVTDAGLVHLKDLTNLKELDLDHPANVTDAGLVHLKDLTMLKSLELRGTKVTDTGLVHLKGMTKLETLNLFGANVTDAGLAHLEGLVKLQQLVLYSTKVTGAGVFKLRQALPNCRIQH